MVLDVSGCVMCEGSNKSYTITVEASNHGGQTTSTTLFLSKISSTYSTAIAYIQLLGALKHISIKHGSFKTGISHYANA